MAPNELPPETATSTAFADVERALEYTNELLTKLEAQLGPALGVSVNAVRTGTDPAPPERGSSMLCARLRSLTETVAGINGRIVGIQGRIEL